MIYEEEIFAPFNDIVETSHITTSWKWSTLLSKFFESNPIPAGQFAPPPCSFFYITQKVLV